MLPNPPRMNEALDQCDPIVHIFEVTPCALCESVGAALPGGGGV